jgi:hypothetical protein
VWYLRLLDSLWWLGRALLALFFTFALASIVPRLQMRACVATHVALDAECAVASLMGTSECCGVSRVKVIIVGYTNGLELTTFACVAVYVDLERQMKFNFFLPET